VKNQAEYAQEEKALADEPSDQDMIEIRVARLKQLLDRLNPEEKALLLMKYQDEFSIKNEIMDITQLSESAIKMRLKRAKEKVVMMSKEMETEV
jgi:RNA polymerase sigma-70 factor (ECF subfamily)